MRNKALLLCAAIGCAALSNAACSDGRGPDLSPGVSRALAEERAATLSAIRYEVYLSVPESVDERVRGRETIRFELRDKAAPLVLDFQPGRESVLAVTANGQEVQYEVTNEHIVIPPQALLEGENAVSIQFLAGDGSLNRNRDYLYTLFVPDRARFAFPCFDQPDLKARYRLTLEVPAAWQAAANGRLQDYQLQGRRATFQFAETAPLSTYLFSFAAGDFQVVSRERGGRELRMYHRETDSTAVARNLAAIFDLHETALDWLESYTGLAYPFEKFDFVLIPSFQYRGMEHPGAILYRASSLFLDESATQSQLLARASLIAHETAHMWFGDLVTMEWFNDVWMKEVFANFMAAKIVNPSFQEIDHELRFLLTHYPSAYEVDRTAGANPIRQRLDNLAEAGTLYGAIIYQKAPIVMRQLELLLGEGALRDGLRQYLNDFALGNANWPDLVEILDSRTADDLTSWSRIWVDEPGRPTIETRLRLDDRGKIESLRLLEGDPAGRGRRWRQPLNLLLEYPSMARSIPVQFAGAELEVAEAQGLPAPRYVLPNGDGVGYGLFVLDDRSREYLLDRAREGDEALTRGVIWLALWDGMLEGQVTPTATLDRAMAALAVEGEELLVQRILDDVETTFWRFLSPEQRWGRADELESLLWSLTDRAMAPSLKAAYFNTLRSVALTEDAVDRLRRLWSGDLTISGLSLSERDHTSLAQALAVRAVRGWDSILDQQYERIENPDRRDRFAFVRPALSLDPDARDRFFESLRDPTNRQHEPWVLEALRFLHHPLRASESEKYIRPSLELLEEVQRTGDIFFPKGWLDATLGGHSSGRAAAVVREFLASHPAYPPRLRAKILQSADGLFRAADILEGSGPTD